MLEEEMSALESILQSDIDFLEKIRAISATLKKLVNADRCTIFIHDPVLRSFWSAYIEGISFIELPDDEGIVHEVFEENKIRIVNNVKNSAVYNEATERETGYVIRSMLAAPIIDQAGQPIGVIQVINKCDGDDFFDDNDASVIDRLMHHIQRHTVRLKG